MRAFHRKGLSTFLLSVVFLYASLGFSKSLWGFLSSDWLPADGGAPIKIYFYQQLSSTRISKENIKVSLGRIGAVSDLGKGLFSVEYFPPSLKKPRVVEFAEKSSGAKGIFHASPYPAGRIVVSVKPHRLLAGRGQEANINIRVWNYRGDPVTNAKLRVTSNIGKVLATRELGSGRYEARFVPPGEAFPQVAIIMVAWPGGARFHRLAVARAVIPISAKLDLPGKTAPGTRMKIAVAGKLFGPVIADSKGDFSLSILVPPGYGTGRATSVDRVGNRKSKIVNLFLPETNQLGIWAYPRKVEVGTDNACRILVTTIDKFGSPMNLRHRKKHGLNIVADRGKIHNLRRIATGLFEAFYTPPDSVGDGEDEISVRFPGGGSKSHANISLTMLPGPASRLVLSLPELLPADGKSKGEVKVELFDALGNRAVGQVVQLDSDVGVLSQVVQRSPGVFTASLVVNPDPPKFNVKVRAIARNPVSTRPAKISVTAGSLRSGKDGGFVLQAVLTDSYAIPVAAGQGVDFKVQGKLLHAMSSANGRVEFVLPEFLAAGLHDGLLTASGGSVRKHVFWVKNGRKSRLLPIELAKSQPSAVPLVASDEILLYPPASVMLSISVGARSINRPWRQVDVFSRDPDGRLLSGRKITISASVGKAGKSMEVAPGHYRATWSPPSGGWSRATLSAFDEESQVGTIIEVKE